MKIAIIGPSNIDRTAGAAGIDPEAVRETARDAGRMLAESGHELVVVPDQGVAVIAAQAYRESRGKKIWGLIPNSGHSAEGSTSRVQRNKTMCDETRDDLSWLEQHSRLVEFCEAMVCVGLSCGTICEIAWTKWTKKIPVFILKNLATRIPPEIEAETDLRYLASLVEIIDALGRPAS